jgi:DNA-binding NtrC family response regulator
VHKCRISSPNALVFHPRVAHAGRLADALRVGGLDVAVTTTPDECVSALRNREYAVVVIDLADAVNRRTETRARVASLPSKPGTDSCPWSDSAGSGLRLSDADRRRLSSSSDDAETIGGDPHGERDESIWSSQLDLLRTIRRVSPVCRVVALVGPRTGLDACCQAVTLGVCGFVDWNDEGDEAALRDRVAQALERHKAAVQERADSQTGQIFDETGLAGQSRLMADLLLQARRAAMISDVPVLVHGESGTGKQLIAEAIHRLDPKRKNLPFLSVNCAAIHGTLAESALFGHVRGAYTGATEARQGYFRAAGGGTLLLDEVSELERALQPKLLRVLQVGKILPVGSDVEVDVSARVIAASNRALPALVESGEFRLDLYQRLNVISLYVPPLRDRPDDVPLLVQFFLRKYASYYPAGIEGVDPRVYDVLAQSIGSGNVRELENTVRQVLAFKAGGHRLELTDLPRELLERRRSQKRDADQVYSALAAAVCWMIRDGRWTLQQMLDEFERLAIREALDASSGTHAELAQRLGITRRTLYNKFRRHGMSGGGSS